MLGTPPAAAARYGVRFTYVPVGPKLRPTIRSFEITRRSAG